MGAIFARGVRPGYQQLQAAAIKRGLGARGETKSVDIPSAVFNLPFNAGNLNSQSVTLVQEGASFFNRIGRKIAMKSLQITAKIESQLGYINTVPELLRYIIFYDKQPNGVAATWNQVVQSYDNAGGVTNSVFDGMNLDNRDRFVILRDRKIALPGLSAAGLGFGVPLGTSEGSVGSDGSDGGIVVKEYLKLGNMEVQFNGGNPNPATVAGVNTGNLAIVLQGQTGAQWTLFGSARLRFTDF